MDAAPAYDRQVRLLTRVLPLVAAEQIFALKGGTAINLFIRDLPRLSVDIDLVYLPMDDRPTALSCSNLGEVHINPFSGFGLSLQTEQPLPPSLVPCQGLPCLACCDGLFTSRQLGIRLAVIPLT